MDNENSDAGHIKCSRGPHLAHVRQVPHPWSTAMFLTQLKFSTLRVVSLFPFVAIYISVFTFHATLLQNEEQAISRFLYPRQV